MLYDYLCRDCAAKRGLLTDIYVGNPLQSAFQADKFEKHTKPPEGLITQPLGVFGSTTTEDYFLRVRRAAAFGVVAVTASGRRNFIDSAPRVGLQYRPNGLILTADCVRAVLTSGEDRVHAFPDVMPARMNVCASCGKPLR